MGVDHALRNTRRSRGEHHQGVIGGRHGTRWDFCTTTKAADVQYAGQISRRTARTGYPNNRVQRFEGGH